MRGTRFCLAANAARPSQLPYAVSWPPPSPIGRKPSAKRTQSFNPKALCADSNSSPSHTTSPASNTGNSPCCQAIFANAKRRLVGPAAAPTRPRFRATPTSQAKPSKATAGAVISPRSHRTRWCHRNARGPSAASMRPVQILASVFCSVDIYLSSFYFYKCIFVNVA